MTADGRKPPENIDFPGGRTTGGNGRALPADRPGAGSARVSDRVPPSRRSAEIEALVSAVRALPDMRYDKVAAIKKAVESGTYVVNAAKVAQKMIDELQ